MYFSGVLAAFLMSSIAMGLPTNIISPADVSEVRDANEGAKTSPIMVNDIHASQGANTGRLYDTHDSEGAITSPIRFDAAHDATGGAVTTPFGVHEHVRGPSINPSTTPSNGVGSTKREADSDICPEGFVVATAAEVVTQLITGGGANSNQDAIMKNHCEKEDDSSLEKKVKGKLGKIWGGA